MLEFGLLSRLTGDSTYEEAAKNALLALDRSAAKLTFMGSQINVDDGSWVYAASGIGAGVDSLYEYLIKSYILFGDPYFLEFYTDIYTRAMSTTLIEDWHLQINVQTNAIFATWTDALSAFWPGMQVLTGDLQHARAGFQRFWSIWKRYGVGLPERFDVSSNRLTISSHSLRPELVESAYMLHSATLDPFYIHAAAEMMYSYEKYCKTPCGYANMANVVTKELDDRMESFFLAETLKYLYLLFTPDHPINKGNYIFTTEAHPIRVQQPWRSKNIQSQPELINTSCAAPPPCSIGFLDKTCTWPNTAYLREPRKFGNQAFQLHYLVDGLRHADVQNVGANVLPAEREVIVTTISSDKDIRSYYAIKGSFGGNLLQSTLPKEVVFAEPLDACSPLVNADSIRGKVALAYRGSCTFSEKCLILEASGATALVFVNNQDTAVFTMSDDKWNPSPIKIPIVLISKEDGEEMRALSQQHMKEGRSMLNISLAPAHPSRFSEFAGVLQFVLQFHPNVPKERWPTLGFAGQNTAFKYGDSFVLMSRKPEDHAFLKEWEGSNFQVFVSNETAPFRITRLIA